MRTQFLLLCFLLSVFMVGCCLSESKKVAIVSVHRVLRETEHERISFRYLEKLNDSIQKELSELRKRQQDNPKDKTLAQEFDEKYNTSINYLNAEKKRVAQLLGYSLQKMLDAYRIQKRLDLILDVRAVASHAPSADITDVIIAEFNKISIDFNAPEPAAQTGNATAPAAK